MDQQQILTLAQRGEAQAIASILNQLLASQEINVTATSKDNILYLLLEASNIPKALPCLYLIKQFLIHLEIKVIDTVYVYGRNRSQKIYNWKHILLLNIPHKTEKKAEFVKTKNPLILNYQTQILVSLVGGLGFLAASSGDLLIPWFSEKQMIIQSEAKETQKINNSAPLLSQTNSSVTEPELLPHIPASGEQNQQASPLIPETKKTIKIKAVGDIIPGTNFPNHKLPEDKNKLFESVKPYFYGADILFGNFESTLTNHPHSAKDISRSNVFAFRTPPEYAQLLHQVGFDVLSVANNHSMDFSEIGFQDTIRHLEATGIKTVGEKGEITYLEVNNIPVAFIGFSTYDYHNTIHDLEAAKKLVQEAKKQAKIVIISIHAGAEGTNALRVQNKTEYFYGENRGNLVLFSRTLVDAGADLILAHGPHVPRAIELYNDKLIAYSLGNFLGYRSLSTVAQLGYSLILEVDLDEQGNFLKGKIIPVHLDGVGIPYIDQYFRTVSLIRDLVKSDFPDTPITINRQGEILKMQ